MLFSRALLSDKSGLPQPSRQGAGWVANPSITEKTTDANHTITVAEMSTGVLYYSALSAGRTVTTPTAALILAAAPDMDIGDAFAFLVSIQDAFAITWAAGTGVTLAGRATTAASSSSWIVVTRTSAVGAAIPTVTWHVL